MGRRDSAATRTGHRMTEIGKRFTFNAAHWLPYVALDHKCRRMHGHTYGVEVVCAGNLINGMVCDYAEITMAWEALREQLDHRTLNDVHGLDNPTAELLAQWIASRLQLPLLVLVRVSETPDTWATVSAGGSQADGTGQR